jgi:hypothetical protein
VARCTFVRDEITGNVCGLWLQDPGLARKQERLVMLAVAESLPMDVYARIVDGDYRVVANTFDAAGGCFVMFGSAPAPGETRGQPPPQKKRWQFWKADAPSDLPGEGQAAHTPGQEPVNPFSTDAVIQGGELRFQCPTCPGGVAVDLGPMDPITGVNAVCPNCRNVSHVPGGYRAGQKPAGLRIWGGVKVPIARFGDWYAAHPLVASLVESGQSDILNDYGLWAFCASCYHQVPATVLTSLPMAQRASGFVFTARTPGSARDMESLVSGRCPSCGHGELIAIVADIPDYVRQARQR